MPKRSLREFVRGLKLQITNETNRLDRMSIERDKTIATENQKVSVQHAKCEALRDVLSALESGAPTATTKKKVTPKAVAGVDPQSPFVPPSSPSF